MSDPKVLPQPDPAPLVGLLLCGLLSLTTPGFAQQGTWTKKADMPTARGWLSASLIDGKLYAVGGRMSSASGSFGVLPTVEEFVYFGN